MKTCAQQNERYRKFIVFFYYSGFSENFLHLSGYIPNVSADVSSDLLQVVLVELRSLHGTSNHVLYFIHGDCLLLFR